MKPSRRFVDSSSHHTSHTTWTNCHTFEHHLSKLLSGEKIKSCTDGGKMFVGLKLSWLGLEYGLGWQLTACTTTNVVKIHKGHRPSEYFFTLNGFTCEFLVFSRCVLQYSPWEKTSYHPITGEGVRRGLLPEPAALIVIYFWNNSSISPQTGMAPPPHSHTPALAPALCIHIFFPLNQRLLPTLPRALGG